MKPDWDKLADESKDSKHGLVGDVDCTAAGKDLCEKHGVSGYPTLKWGDPTDLQEYSGARDFKGLKSFADENLGPTCGPTNLDLCDDDQKKMIAKFQKMDVDELDIKIEESDAKMTTLEKGFKKTTDSLEKQIKALQSKIESENKKKDSKLAKETKKLGIPMMKKVLHAKGYFMKKVKASMSVGEDEKDDVKTPEKDEM